MNNINVPINRSDLLLMEDRICSNLSLFINFASHALYFPEYSEKAAVLLSSERKALVPLIWRNEVLGMLLLSGIKVRQLRSLLPWLPGLASSFIGMEALRLSHARDSLTSLASEESFFSHLENEITSIRDKNENAPHSVRLGQDIYRLCMGMIVLRWGDARETAREYGPTFVREAFKRIALALNDALPENAVAAPLGRFEGRYEFGIIVPAAGTTACLRQAQAILERLEPLVFDLPLANASYQPALFAGFALYPHDMRGDELLLPVFDQVSRLRDRARLASRLAALAFEPTLQGRILGFRDILRKGGRILECLPNGKLRINIGIAANLHEGMRFDVYSNSGNAASGVKKGQMIVLSAGSMDALAEMIYVTEAGVSPAPGDRLFLAEYGSGPSSKHVQPDTEREIALSEGQWPGYSDFFNAFENDVANRFVLGIVRLTGTENSDFQENFAKLRIGMEKLSPRPQYYGMYGSGSLLFYHSDATAKDVLPFYEKIAEMAEELRINVASGLFEWPFLDFGKSESEICAIKALEYAELLPSPHIGVFDSIALTISADKLYSLGDTFSAIREYETAVLADPKNVTACNSLGVALAALGKIDQAKRYFTRALRICKQAEIIAQICYNLGAIHQQQNNLAVARTFYRRCVEKNPGHCWGWLRLGQISEINGRRSDAFAMYEKAVEAAGEDERLANTGRRQIARLRARQNKSGEARELLHDILLSDPGDVASMLELAKLYLDNETDLAMAELFANKAVNLGGGMQARRLLALALEKQGKLDEAEKVRQRGL